MQPGIEESRRGLAAGGLVPPFPRTDPSREGGILDAAFPGEDRGAQAAGFKSSENLAVVLGSVAGASGLIGFDDDAGGLLDIGFPKTGILSQTAAAG